MFSKGDKIFALRPYTIITALKFDTEQGWEVESYDVEGIRGGAAILMRQLHPEGPAPWRLIPGNGKATITLKNDWVRIASQKEKCLHF